MINAQNTKFATVTQLAKSAIQALRAMLIWFTGMPASAVMAHRMDVQMRYTAAGFVLVTWYVFMLIVWCKTGLHFFGTGGALASALVPSIMLAIDRMVISQPRNPGGELAAYAIDALKPKKWEYAMRVAVALVFSAVTTFTFLITEGQADIQAGQKRDQQLANATLRAEIVARIESQISERTRTVVARSTDLDAEAKILREDYADSRKQAGEAEVQFSGAQYNVAAELGGIEGRSQGEGARHDAYKLVATQSKDIAFRARARENRSRELLVKVQVEQQALNKERERIAKDRASALGNVDGDLQEDERFVARKRGLFADATTLVKLYGDKDLGSGMILTNVGVSMFLLVIELAPLLALAFLATTVFDVERIADNRADASRIVADLEKDLLNSSSRRTVRVTPVSRRQSHPPHGADQPEEAQQREGAAA